VVVIRLHGPDRKGIEKKTDKRWNEIVALRDNELARVAEMTRDLLSQGIDVYYEGSAPLTIERIKELL
jgi:hypothetical protein